MGQIKLKCQRLLRFNISCFNQQLFKLLPRNAINQLILQFVQVGRANHFTKLKINEKLRFNLQYLDDHKIKSFSLFSKWEFQLKRLVFPYIAQ